MMHGALRYQDMRFAAFGVVGMTIGWAGMRQARIADLLHHSLVFPGSNDKSTRD